FLLIISTFSAATCRPSGGFMGAGHNAPFPTSFRRKSVWLSATRPVEGLSIVRLAARPGAPGQNFGTRTMTSRDRVKGPGHADYSAATEDVSGLACGGFAGS
ncbi:MAG: hypothetical protein JWP25_8215, partial [Bradyrhizobium sp.]|nr:hypothetical protein [Bradyrhizobium sp.]